MFLQNKKIEMSSHTFEILHIYMKSSTCAPTVNLNIKQTFNQYSILLEMIHVCGFSEITSWKII